MYYKAYRLFNYTFWINVSLIMYAIVTCLMVIVGERQRRVPPYPNVVCAKLLDQLTILKVFDYDFEMI